MRILRTSAFFAISVLVACGGGGKSNNPDAAPPDMPPPDMAPPDMPVDMPPALDFSCEGMPDPTTAADPIKASGTTSEISQGGATAVAGVTVDTFKIGVANRLDRVVSDATGAFTTGNIATGGVPFSGFLLAAHDGDRSSAVFPPTPLAADAANVPVLLTPTGTFALIEQVAGVQQDDAANGALLVAITDCANTPVAGATLSVKQNNAEVGTQFDLGQVAAQAKGVFFVFNVPAGNAEISATFETHTFPARTVVAIKNTGNVTAGTTSTTQLRPGP
jgi:hypothetical protein